MSEKNKLSLICIAVSKIQAPKQIKLIIKKHYTAQPLNYRVKLKQNPDNV